MTPILPRQAGRTGGSDLVLAAVVGAGTVEPQLAALGPLRRALGRGEVVLVDDGTLGGADRVRLARACGDPRYLAPSEMHRGALPQSPEWGLLLTALERRRNAYWLLFDGAEPAEAATPALDRAIGSNRSFAVVDDGPPPRELAALASDGWPYVNRTRGPIGLAAGGDGKTLAVAVVGLIEQTLGPAGGPETARIAANFVLGREREPVLVPFVARHAR